MAIFKRQGIPAHRQGIPSGLYWLVDRLEVHRVNQLTTQSNISDLTKTLDLLIEYHIAIDERIRYMQRSWDELKTEVAALKDLPASVAAGFAALQAKLAAAIEAGAGALPQAEVDALKADVAAAVTEIRAAVVANT